MAGRSKSKGRRDAKPAAKPTSSPGSGVDRQAARRATIEIAGGVVLVVVGLLVTLLAAKGGMLVFGYGPVIVGILAIIRGCVRQTRALHPPFAPRPDVRRWIYGGLDLLFAAAYILVISMVIPNRLPSAAFHLWTIPIGTLVMAAGTLTGRRIGWWVAIVGGSVVLLSMIVLILRILISAAFLAGVYGAFGKAASTFAFVAVALIIEVVALLPIVQIKFLMSRAGRRAYV